MSKVAASPKLAATARPKTTSSGPRPLDTGLRKDPPAAPPDSDPAIATVRAFNRFYTRRIGVLDEGLLATPFTLTESRLLWEFAHRERVTASELARDLGLDRGYLSRLLRGLRERGLIAS